MRRLRPIYCCLLLLGLTLAAYWPVWRNGFVDFDDEWYITTNPHVVQGLNWSSFRWAWTNTRANYWMPLTWLTFQVDASIIPSRSPAGERLPSPAVVHGQNLLWHSLNVLLLFGLLKRWTGATGRSFLVAALFAAHPMHVESVAWAAERKDVLSVFFGLVTLWAYGAYVAKPSWQRYGLVAAAYVLSLLAKPMLVTLPIILLLLDFWPLARLSGKNRRLGRLVLEKVPLLALAVAIGLATFCAFENTGIAVSTVYLPWPDRLANAATAYGWYLLHTFWPVDLAVLYPHPYHAWSLGATILGACLLVGITGFALRQAQPWLLVGWLWFVVSLLPVIGLIQGGEQAWADRFCYWPHIGLLIAVVWMLASLTADWGVPAWLGTAAATVAVVGLMWSSIFQVTFWRDSATLWQQAVEVTRDNDVAHLHLGYYYLQHGQLEDARNHFAEAVSIRPEVANHQFMLGVILLAQGQLEYAIEHLQRAVEASPQHAKAWQSLALARMQQGHWSEAARCFREMLALQPDSPEAQTGLGQALWQIGRRQEAEDAFHTAVKLDPQQADAWHGLGQAALARGQTTEAIQDFSKAMQANPQLVQAYSDLGLAFARDEQWNRAANYQREAIQMLDRIKRQGQKPELPLAEGCSAAVVYRCRLAYALERLGQHQPAQETYRTASEFDPKWPEKFTKRAWQLATDANNRDPRLAFELATQALESGGNASADTLEALAAAQAALGRFEDAVKSARQALQRAGATGDTEQARSIREHLQCYEHGRTVEERKSKSR
jgi:tetratricopeptide (TPR) repeat protein